MAYLEDADRIGQPLSDKFYDSFYDEQPENFVYFDKYIYPKNISVEDLAELEERLDDWTYKAKEEYDEYYCGDIRSTILKPNKTSKCARSAKGFRVNIRIGKILNLSSQRAVIFAKA